MSIRESRGHIRRHNAAKLVKAIVASVGIAALTYVAVVATQHALPFVHASSGFVPESRMMNPKPAAETVDAHATGKARAAESNAPAAAVPVRDFDYFPDHYVNQATKIEEQPPTF